jgi:hypothetical protein
VGGRAVGRVGAWRWPVSGVVPWRRAAAARLPARVRVNADVGREAANGWPDAYVGGLEIWGTKLGPC